MDPHPDHHPRIDRYQQSDYSAHISYFRPIQAPERFVELDPEMAQTLMDQASYIFI